MRRILRNRRHTCDFSPTKKSVGGRFSTSDLTNASRDVSCCWIAVNLHLSHIFVERGDTTFTLFSLLIMRICLVTAVAFLASQSEAFAPASFGVQRSSALQSSIAPNGIRTTPASIETTVAAAPKVAQRWRKSTKQLVTLGPASSSLEVRSTMEMETCLWWEVALSHACFVGFFCYSFLDD